MVYSEDTRKSLRVQGFSHSHKTSAGEVNESKPLLECRRTGRKRNMKQPE